MDEGPITHPGVPGEVYHTMGKKTFWIFLLQRIHAPSVLLLITIVLFVATGQPSLTATPFGNLAHYAAIATLVCGAAFVVALLIVLLVAALIYNSYKYCLGEDSLKIKRGIFDKKEVAIPYRQIQDVDIDRDLMFQMLGLSRIVILTAGHDDTGPINDESEGNLPALDKDLAEWFQAELLRRANVQKVTEEHSVAPAAAEVSQVPQVNDQPPAN